MKIFENSLFKVGQIFGFLVGYFILTTVWFFIFSKLNKLPKDWTYLHMLLVTATLTIIGLSIKRYFR